MKLPLRCALPLVVTAAAAAALAQAATPGEVAVAAPDRLDRFVHGLGRVVEGAGIAVIMLGALIASVLFLRDLLRGGALAEAYHSYRANLGRGILLGLEFLVAADIIGTVAVDPTLDNLAVLAVIVLIRTFLSFSLELEIEGRWPWQHGREGRRPDAPAG